MKKLAAIGAIGVMASCLFAQGLNTNVNKDDWEEINFEFNSAILSDGYPSLLRLADLLKQHPDYRVKVTGHTDYIGSAAYNNKLALTRANTVRDFLVKYGATASRIETSADGKRTPEVSNKSKEGRFMNRRVAMTVVDGSGKTVSAGGVGDAIRSFDEFMKKQEECCSQILKRLDKLDDILAAVKDLKGENDRLKTEMADLRNQQGALKEQITAMPKPLTAQETTEIAHKEGTNTLDEAQRRNKKFSLLGLNIGPTIGAGRTGNFSVNGSGRYFSPFGGDGMRAVQAQGEYSYYPGRQEGQFDIGLVNRWRNIQAGMFSSFKYVGFSDYQKGGVLGQAAFAADYLFGRGKVGIFGTKGFKNEAVLNRTNIGPESFLETYARIVDQVGVSAQVGVWGNSYLEGNLGYLKRHGTGSDRPGGLIRLVQPLNGVFAVTFEAGLNESFLNTKDSGRVVMGFQFGNFVKPKEFAQIKTPVPMDVPRIRYEMLTRRVGNSPPVADAGSDQVNASAGTITLDGSGSYDPDGDPLTYSWTQTAGPAISLAGMSSVKATFTAAAGQTYSFRLTVKDPSGQQATASVSVITSTVTTVRVLAFTASPTTIAAGAQSKLSWMVEGADTVTISSIANNVDSKSGTYDVSPAATTTYTLTAKGAGGTVTANVTVTVTGTTSSDPKIVRFEATPANILSGESSTLSWTTENGATVSISGIGTVDASGSKTVSPTTTTTYTLTVKGSDGSQVSSPVIVTVGAGNAPQVISFASNPVNIAAGGSAQLCWDVENANSVDIQGIGTGLKSSDCTSVSPTTTTTYTLTAKNNSGTISATATVTVGSLVRITSFTSNPVYSAKSGDPVVISWNTDGASTVTLNGNFVPSGTLAVNGSVTVYPTTNSTYTLTAYGSNGSSVSAVLYVFVR
jgi:hypothetical protein